MKYHKKSTIKISKIKSIVKHFIKQKHKTLKRKDALIEYGHRTSARCISSMTSVANDRELKI